MSSFVHHLRIFVRIRRRRRSVGFRRWWTDFGLFGALGLWSSSWFWCFVGELLSFGLSLYLSCTSSNTIRSCGQEGGKISQHHWMITLVIIRSHIIASKIDLCLNTLCLLLSNRIKSPRRCCKLYWTKLSRTFASLPIPFNTLMSKSPPMTVAPKCAAEISKLPVPTKGSITKLPGFT